MIGNRIKHLREQRGVSQAELALILKCNRMTINNYESGKRIPDIEFAMNAADYFDVTVEYLSGRTEFRDKDDIVVSVKKAEKLVETIEKLPQGESQDMLDYFINILDNAKENDIEAPIIFGLMNCFLQLDKLVDGYIHLEKSIVPAIIELRRRKVPESIIWSVCKDKTDELYQRSFEASKAMTDTIGLCTEDIKKVLNKVMEDVLNEK